MSTDDELQLQLPLPELQQSAARQLGTMGPTERAVRSAIAGAQLDDRDAGGAEVACQQARAIDAAQAKGRDYAIAQLSRELREQLMRLRLDPASRLGNDAGEIAGWLQRIATPTAKD